MASIDRSDWLKDVFARVLNQQDINRQPLSNYPGLSDKENNQLRQPQVFEDELVQVLGVHEDFSLMKKLEGTLGWMPSMHLASAALSKQGIDYSSLTQLYYLHVHCSVLPWIREFSENLAYKDQWMTLKTIT
jgi:hypothetical protein